MLLVLFSPEAQNLAISIKKIEIDDIHNCYSMDKTLWLRKCKYDPGK